MAGRNPERGRHSLQQSLHAIRRRLPELQVRSHADRIHIDAETIGVDVDELRLAARAADWQKVLAVYQHEFLQDWSFEGELGHWCTEMRDALAAGASLALHQALEQQSSAANWVATEQIATRLMQIEGWSERVVEKRLTAIALQGDPSRTKAEVSVAIHSADADASAEFAEFLRRLGGQTSSRSEGQAEAGFVGRSAELGRLLALLQDAWDDRGPAVMVTGPAGVGKTRLAMQLLRICSIQGGRSIEVRCSALRQHVAYGVILDLLESCSASTLRNLDVRRMALVRSIASTGNWTDHALSPRETVRDAIADLVLNAMGYESEKAPLVLLIDDAHYADWTSMTLLADLARQRLLPRCMLLLTSRSEEHRHAVDATVRQFGTALFLQELGELDSESVAELAREFERRNKMVLSAVDLAAIVAIAGGQPLYLIELFNEIRTNGPRAAPRPTHLPLPARLEAHVKSRLKAIDAASTALLSAIACWGQPTAVSDLESVTGLSEPEILRTIDELATLGLLSESDAKIAFRHDVIGDAVDGMSSVTRRQLYHSRIAEVLRERESSVSPAVMSHHLRAAGKRAEACEYAILAAQASERLHAVPETEALLDLAISTAPNAQLRDRALVELARVYLSIRRYDDAVRAYEQVDCTDQPETALRAEFARLAARAHTGSIGPEELVGLLDRIANQAEALHQVDALLDYLCSLAPVLGVRGHPALCRAVLERLSDSAESGISSFSRVNARATAGQMVTFLGDLKAGALQIDAACSDESLATNWQARARALSARAWFRLMASRINESVDDYEVVLQELQTHGAYAWRSSQLHSYGICLWKLGRMAEAESALEEGVRYCRRYGDTVDRQSCLLNLAFVQLARGKYREARVTAEAVFAEVASPGASTVTASAWAIIGLSTLALSPQDPAIAEAEARILGWIEPADTLFDIYAVYIFLARLSWSRGRFALAMKYLDRGTSEERDRKIGSWAELVLERARLLAEWDADSALAEVEGMQRSLAARGANGPVYEIASTMAVIRASAHG